MRKLIVLALFGTCISLILLGTFIVGIITSNYSVMLFIVFIAVTVALATTPKRS